jgi:hypothetical protein
VYWVSTDKTKTHIGDGKNLKPLPLLGDYNRMIFETHTSNSFPFENIISYSIYC